MIFSLTDLFIVSTSASRLVLNNSFFVQVSAEPISLLLARPISAQGCSAPSPLGSTVQRVLAFSAAVVPMHNGSPPPAVLRVTAACGPEARPRSSSAPTIKLLATQRSGKCPGGNFRTSWDLLPRAPRAFRSKHRSGARRCSFAAQREHLEHHLCRINVLLVTMQLGLGASMTALGLFLKQLSPSLTWKECAVWAAGPVSEKIRCGKRCADSL